MSLKRWAALLKEATTSMQLQKEKQAYNALNDLENEMDNNIQQGTWFE